MSAPTRSAITLAELSRRVANALGTAPDLCGVWVTAETSDLRVSGGHCYMELLQKDEQGRPLARARANVWASTWRTISAKFAKATGSAPVSGIKIMALVSVTYHPNYGLALNITDIDPSYTIGEAARRRNEIIARLTAEGLVGVNRRVKLHIPTSRVAVVSAKGAAGYGDFINQLFNNTLQLAFSVTFFEATMQGEKTVPSVMRALQQIQDSADDFDAVVIIRGGGSTSDLAAFDDYDLAARVARFPLPVIIGIGHERDITVLDYVAYMRVKTPTAAAEWLINRGKAILDSLERAASMIYIAVTERLTGQREKLAHIAATLPAQVSVAVTRHGARLDSLAQAVAVAVDRRLNDNRQRLDRLGALLEVLSPQSVLNRGFSMTLGADGHALRSAADAAPGTVLRTILADGELSSTVTEQKL